LLKFEFYPAQQKESIMRRSKSKTPSAGSKNKRPPSGPRVDWVPPHPALGAQVN